MQVLQAIISELMGSHTGLLFVGLVVTAAILHGIAPEERPRVRLLSMMVAGHFVLAVVAGVMSALSLEGRTIVHFVSDALAAMAGVGMVINVVFPLASRQLRLPLPPIVRDLVGAAAYLLVLVVLAGRAGINVTGLVATSAVLTAVVGLSLQDTLGNMVAGLTLQSDSAVRLGEWIQIGDVQGRVVEMRWRFTALETRDGETLVVPNSVLIKDKIRVLGRRQTGPTAWRRWVRFRVDHHVRHSEVIDAVTHALRTPPLPTAMLADPAADCVVSALEHGVTEYAVRYWLGDPGPDAVADSDVRRRITAALSRAGIHHAYPVERRIMIDDDALAAAARSAELARRVHVMQRVALLSLVPPDKQVDIAKQVTEVVFEPGEVLFRQGEPSDSAFVIDDGHVSIRIADATGVEHEIAQLGPGEVLGEMGVMTGDNRTATALALGPVRACRLERHTFETLLRAHPGVAESLAKTLASRQAAQAVARQKLGPEDSELAERRDMNRVLARIRFFFGLEG